MDSRVGVHCASPVFLVRHDCQPLALVGSIALNVIGKAQATMNMYISSATNACTQSNKISTQTIGVHGKWRTGLYLVLYLLARATVSHIDLFTEYCHLYEGLQIVFVLAQRPSPF